LPEGVTPVTRRELHDFGLVLYGEEPAALLPPVTGGQLAEFVVQDLESFWLPSLDHPERWDRDIWVDLGLLTLARATVTLRDDKLITKARALCVLTELGAPAEVVDDIRQRRYGNPGPASQLWIAHRAELTLTFLRPAIEQVVARWPPSAGPEHENRQRATGRRQAERCSSWPPGSSRRPRAACYA
jgi:hypothetical protein